jgi:hypothetical protein
LVKQDGSVVALGSAPLLGDAKGQLRDTAIQIAPTRSGDGYWIVSAAGDVVAFGDAREAGDLSGERLAAPIVGLAPDRAGGYHLATADGAVFSFEAPPRGAPGLEAAQPIVAIEATASREGYWLTDAGGRIWAFGDAGFYGDTRNIRLNRPVVDMAATLNGYELIDDTGAIYCHGNATFRGSTEGRPPAPIVAIVAMADDRGYWMAGQDGAVFAFGDAPPLGTHRI